MTLRNGHSPAHELRKIRLESNRERLTVAAAELRKQAAAVEAAPPGERDVLRQDLLRRTAELVVKVDADLIELELKAGVRTRPPIRKKDETLAERVREIAADRSVGKRSTWEGLL